MVLGSRALDPPVKTHSTLRNDARDGRATSGVMCADATSARNNAGSRTLEDARIALATNSNHAQSCGCGDWLKDRQAFSLGPPCDGPQGAARAPLVVRFGLRGPTQPCASGSSRSRRRTTWSRGQRSSRPRDGVARQRQDRRRDGATRGRKGLQWPTRSEGGWLSNREWGVAPARSLTGDRIEIRDEDAPQGESNKGDGAAGIADSLSWPGRAGLVMAW